MKATVNLRVEGNDLDAMVPELEKQLVDLVGEERAAPLDVLAVSELAMAPVYYAFSGSAVRWEAEIRVEVQL